MRRLSLVAILVLASCTTKPVPQVVEVPRPKPLLGNHGFSLSSIDRDVRPCDDFYGYATGNWRKKNPLPATFPRFGSFEVVAERNRAILRSVLEEAARAGTSTTANFWTACMDEEGIEARGLAPIRDDLARIDAINDRRALVAEIQRLQQRAIPTFGVEVRGGNPLFSFGAQNDFKSSEQVIGVISQGGLGMPDRDYYLRDDGTFVETRKAYVDHMTKMFQLAGMTATQAKSDAEKVLALERELAIVSMPRVEQRIPENVYHPTAVSELSASQPNLEWPAFFASIGLNLESVNVAQPAYFATANRLVAGTPIDWWKAYLRWNVIDAAAPALPRAFVQQDYAFRGATLSGQKELQPRWQRCVRFADVSIGNLIGQEYVKRNFTPEAKERMNELIDNLIAALREDIPTLRWMGNETKSEALAKLNAFKRRIGYPDAWRDYSSLTLTPDAYLGNLNASREFAFRHTVDRIGKPDDPNFWGAFTPATVNASYNAARNFISFPAGILQPPFFDPNADDAYNYGGIGSVIGHEMTHGFDDRGARFDATGNLRNWWSEADLKNFESRAACISDQYSGFVVEPGLNIQGKLVTGEAIADLGGVTLAYRAYQKSLEGKKREPLDGMTPEQRFFLGFAQVWSENMAIEEQRRRALTDSHAQGPFRVNGTVSNMPEFKDAWNCPAGGAMVRADSARCDIW